MKLTLYYPMKPYRPGGKFGVCPPGKVCEYYRNVLGLKGHNGIDVPCDTGTPVYASHDGTVTFAGEDGSAGMGVVIRTHEKFDYEKGQAYFKTIYWHLKKDGIKVKAGQKVKAGDLIALANNTGFSTGSHLHFGLKPVYKGEKDWEWWNAEQDNGYKGAIDPDPYFVGYYGNLPAWHFIEMYAAKLADEGKIKQSNHFYAIAQFVKGITGL